MLSIITKKNNNCKYYILKYKKLLHLKIIISYSLN